MNEWICKYENEGTRKMENKGNAGSFSHLNKLNPSRTSEKVIARGIKTTPLCITTPL